MTPELERRIREVQQQAQASGALLPIETRHEVVDDHGVPFVVRVVDSIERKSRERSVPRPPDFDPFEPYDEELFVAEAGVSHVVLLNKFPVLERHALIVTRRFEHQELPLTLADFTALGTCLGEVAWLAFYNSGPVAGASQTHRHFQLVPLPLAPGVDGVPIAAAFGAGGDPVRLPFEHVVSWAPAGSFDPHVAHRDYLRALDELGLRTTSECRPYNLLLTADWMFVVPRTAEAVDGISVNAIGYAGALLAKDDASLGAIRAHGPMDMLRRLARPL